MQRNFFKSSQKCLASNVANSSLNLFSQSVIYNRYTLKQRIFNILFFNNFKNYSTSQEFSNIQGIFIIIIINLKVKPTALFIFYNSNKYQITDYKFHSGKSYYKEFSYFVINALKNQKFNDENSINILAPKHFINNTLVNNCKILLGVTLNPYSRKSPKLPSVIDDIKKDIKSISSIDKEKFDHAITIFNSKSYKSFSSILSSGNQIIKRMYSTCAVGYPEEKVIKENSQSKSLIAILPIIQYSNADLLKVNIVKENRGKTGIYRWINLDSNNSYVGSSIDLGRRFRGYYNYTHLTHPLNKGMVIYRALLKYGYSKFKLEILEYCDRENLHEREQYYLDLLNPKYNVLTKAGSILGYKHTKEAIAKIRISQKGKNNSFFGKTHSEEYKEILSIRMSKQNSGEKHPKYGKPIAENHKLAISQAISKPIYLYDVHTLSLIVKYTKQRDLVKDFKIAPKTIIKYRDSGMIYKEKYIIRSKPIDDKE
jgi:group I intron endonuclease